MPISCTVTTEALAMSRLSNGALDVTVLPLMRLWGFVQRAGRIPSGRGHTRHAASGRLPTIQVDRPRRAIRFTARAWRWISAASPKDLRWIGHRHPPGHGVDQALVNAGGDLFALGVAGADERLDGGYPASYIPEKSLGTLQVRDRSIATSGDYEKYFEQDGERYCHLIDPRTGYPVQGVASVTVLADTAMHADALSTAVFALGAEAGLALLERLPGVEGVIAAKRQRKREGLDVRMTSGLRGALTLTDAG